MTQTLDAETIDRTGYKMAPEPKLPVIAGHPAPQPAEAPANAVAAIAAAIAAVMEEIGIIPKGGTNKFQNYDYARIEDILQRLTPLMGKHGIIIVPSEKSRNLFDNESVVMATYSFTLIHKSGGIWPYPLEWTGISRARDSKGGFDDKSLNKCATAAQKEFLKKLFQIPVGDETDAHDTSAEAYPQKQAAPPPKPRTKAAAPVQAPTDPITGEVSPHAIHVTTKDGKFNWIGFGQSFLAALKASKDADECQQWDEANAANLGTMLKQAPDVHKRLMAAIETQVGYARQAVDVQVLDQQVRQPAAAEAEADLI